MDLKSKVRVIEDFPVKGISFKDITTLTSDKDAYIETIDRLAEGLEDKDVDYIVGPEARGFLFGAAVAYKMGVAFVPVRKPGKLPGEIVSKEYDLEYGTNTLEIHIDSIKKGSRVAIVDDLLATGGTINAVVKMIEEMGSSVVGIQFLIELESLEGRKGLEDYSINSLIKYDI